LIVAIHQPQYLPWLGYFDKMFKADAFCYLDNVQYKKNEWQNRNCIKAGNGPQWLTVPVRYRFPQKIREVRIDNRASWRKKHLQTLRTCYGKAPFFQKYFYIFEEVYETNWEYLSDLNIHCAESIRRLLGIPLTRTARASEFELSENPTDRLIDICKTFGGDTYLSGKEGRCYMDVARFEERGMEIVFQDFKVPSYPQLFGEFQSHLSVVDLLFNCGPKSLNKIKGAL